MQFKQKLAYIALGGFLVFIGQLLPNIIAGGSATAQDQKTDAQFDEVTCRSLKVVDAQGKTYALLKKESSGNTAHLIQVFNSRGDMICNISEDSNGGYISVKSTNGLARATMGIDERKKDARVWVTDANGTQQAWMMVDQYGGKVVSR